MASGLRLRIGLLAVLAIAVLAPAAADAALKAPRVTTVTVPEGPSSVAKFTVTLPRKARGRIRVPYRTIDRTAKAGADYVRKAGKLVFKRGQRKKTISVRILDDSLDEPNETFVLKISAVKARLKAKSATGTIVDNDPAPTTGGGGTTTTGDGTTTTGGGGTTTPPAETCNGVDDDQDGAVDDGVCIITVTLSGAGSGTVTSNPAGIDCPATCSASFPGPVTLTATAASGSGFTGWGGACTGTSTTCDLSSGERSVTATFTNSPVTGQLVINEILADPSATTGDANGDGAVSVTDDEFIEIYNGAGLAVNLQNYTIEDSAQLRHTFGSTVVQPGCSIVVFGGGTPTGSFGGAAVATASTTGLGFSNTGDTVSISDPLAVVVATHTYGPEGGSDQSLTREPDISGSFVQHSTAVGSSGAFSPGTTLSGAAFDGCS